MLLSKYQEVVPVSRKVEAELGKLPGSIGVVPTVTPDRVTE